MTKITSEMQGSAVGERAIFGGDQASDFRKRRKKMDITLWIVQVALALLFLLAGGTKLVLPMDTLTSMGSPNQILLPGFFIRLIGVAEVLGALGLILPGLLRIRTGLTALAAAGLVIIMIGATALTLASGDAGAFFPLAVGLFSIFVVYGRSR
jgi:uncharacterized membrane protein YphA (DoxX/SURF4 family)